MQIETLVMCNIAVCIKITFMNYLNVENNRGILFDFSVRVCVFVCACVRVCVENSTEM
jgi:hypothetical protein